MGQRLIFKLYRGKELEDHYCIGAVHFHWSAYTISCYEEAKVLIDGLKRHNYRSDMTDKETLQIILDTLQEYEVTFPENITNDGTVIPEHTVHGGVLKCDIVAARGEGLEFTENNVSNTMGLLAITPEGVKSLEDYAEDIEYFYIDSEYYSNSLFTEMTVQSFKDIGVEIDINSIPDWNPPVNDIELPKFEETEKLIEWLNGFDNEWVIGKYEYDDNLFFVTIYK